VKVFVLTSAFDYEGETAFGAFASLSLAQAAAQERAITAGYEPGDWVYLGGGDARWELQFGSQQWVIREEEVQGYEPDCCESMKLYGRCNG